MGESGLDVKLSEAARKAVGFAIEAKNQEKINILGCTRSGRRKWR